MLNLLDRHTIGQLLRTKDVDAWGVASNDPRLPLAPDLPIAISMLMRIDPLVVRGLRHGPTEDYEEEYLRLNVALDDATQTLVDVLRVPRPRGRACRRHARRHRQRRPPFPHKSAATRAGLGWIGKTALFVSPEFGPAVRLSTVFTDLDLPAGEPVTERLLRATAGSAWTPAPPAAARTCCGAPGMAREVLFDAGACRHQMTPLQRRRLADLRHLHRRLPVRAPALTAAHVTRARCAPRRCPPSTRVLCSVTY